MEYQFRVHATRADGSANRRFHKIRYTAALRLGVVLHAERGFVELRFDGQPIDDVTAHGDNSAYCGQMTLEGRTFSDVVVIVRHRDTQKVDLVTFWPRSQHPDAHQSYTDPLVDTAMDGTPFNIDAVASRMHEAFRDNAGASPATLMKLLYEEETEAIRSSAHRLADLLQESLDREREAIAALDSERTAREAAESAHNALHERLDEVSREAEQARSERDELQELVAALKAQAASHASTSPVLAVDAAQGDLKAPAKAVTRQWRSHTKNSNYMNVGVEAFIESVTRQENRICLTFIDSTGGSRTIHDFGVINGFVSRIFDYLLSRKGRRAVFLITWKPGGHSMLASDTMMLEKYSALWN